AKCSLVNAFMDTRVAWCGALGTCARMRSLLILLGTLVLVRLVPFFALGAVVLFLFLLMLLVSAASSVDRLGALGAVLSAFGDAFRCLGLLLLHQLLYNFLALMGHLGGLRVH